MKKYYVFLLAAWLLIGSFTAKASRTASIHLINAGKPDSTAIINNFNWMVNKVSLNYSGYKDKAISMFQLNSFTDSIRTLISKTNSMEKALPLFKSWLKWFKDPHLIIYIKSIQSTAQQTKDPLKEKFIFVPTDKNTNLIAIPSFNIRYKKIIDSLLITNDKLLKTKNNLVVDLRNNGGGSDESFSNLLPLLYTNPIISINSDIWSTEDNVLKYQSIAGNNNYSLDTRTRMSKFVEIMKSNPGQFISSGNDDTLKLNSISRMPEKIIILINNKVASSAEGFLLQARQSRKVVVAGTNSRGELDYANVNYIDSPDKMLTLGYPTSRSRRLPGYPIDNIGIRPDIDLSNRNDWMEYVNSHINDYEFSPNCFMRSIPYNSINRNIYRTIKDTSLINLNQLAASITHSFVSDVEKVKQVIDWTNRNFEWTYTDYKKRTIKEIIARGGGNCAEQTRVTKKLLSIIGIKTRNVSEINIQPENNERQASAEEKVKKAGNKMSVFGLNYNDHVWFEFYDKEDGQWKPADPSLGLVGIENWVIARIGFAPRLTHNIIPSQDMLVPFAIFVTEGNDYIDRSGYYLIDKFNLAYGGRMEKMNDWKKWAKIISDVSPLCKDAFNGNYNLHKSIDTIKEIKTLYLGLKEDFEKSDK